MTKWHAQVVHLSKHMIMVGSPLPNPLNSGAASSHMWNRESCNLWFHSEMGWSKLDFHIYDFYQLSTLLYFPSNS